jgi:hypothetical protein
MIQNIKNAPYNNIFKKQLVFDVYLFTYQKYGGLRCDYSSNPLNIEKLYINALLVGFIIGNCYSAAVLIRKMLYNINLNSIATLVAIMV